MLYFVLHLGFHFGGYVRVFVRAFSDLLLLLLPLRRRLLWSSIEMNERMASKTGVRGNASEEERTLLSVNPAICAFL